MLVFPRPVRPMDYTPGSHPDGTMSNAEAEDWYACCGHCDTGDCTDCENIRIAIVGDVWCEDRGDAASHDDVSCSECVSLKLGEWTDLIRLQAEFCERRAAEPALEAEYARAEAAKARARADAAPASESGDEDGEPEVVSWMREALATYDGQDRWCPGEFVAEAKGALDAFDAGGADCGDCDHNECAQSVRQENGDGDDEEGSDRRTTLGDDQVVGNMRIAGARAWKDMDCTCAGLCNYERAVGAWAMNGFRCERVFDLRQRASRARQDRRGHGDGGGGGGKGGGKRQRGC